VIETVDQNFCAYTQIEPVEKPQLPDFFQSEEKTPAPFGTAKFGGEENKLAGLYSFIKSQIEHDVDEEEEQN
jgi:hypothetical protein